MPAGPLKQSGLLALPDAQEQRENKRLAKSNILEAGARSRLFFKAMTLCSGSWGSFSAAFSPVAGSKAILC